MEKNNNFLRNIAKVIEAGLISSKDIKKEVENTIKFRIEQIVGKLNLVSREEFELQKKKTEKLINDIKNLKGKRKKKIKKLNGQSNFNSKAFIGTGFEHNISSM